MTFCAWVKPVNHTVSDVKAIVAITASTSPSNTWMIYEYASTAHAFQAAGGTADQSAGSLTSNNWYSTAALFSSNTSRQIYRNNTAGTVNTTNLATANVNRTMIGAYIASAAVTGYANDDICEVAIWSATLNVDEINSLYRGFKPHRVRPQSLVYYAPLVREVADVRGGLAITNTNGATVANHPRVY